MNYLKASLDTTESKEFFPGFRGKMIHTDEMTLAYWDIAMGSALPEHSHYHKQIVQVISGEFSMVIGGVEKVYASGSIIEIPGDVPHSGKAITDCVIHDIFLPAREDYQ